MRSKISSLIVIVATLVVAIVRIATNPQDIILHWDFNGNVTSYGPRYLILLLPFISLILYAILLQYEKNPFRLGRIAKQKQTKGNAKKLTAFIQLCTPIILLLMLYVAICSAQYLPLYTLVPVVILLLIIGLYIRTYRKLR